MKTLVRGLTQATDLRADREQGAGAAAGTIPPPRSAACATTWPRSAATPPPTRLTNLANRKAFDDELERACAEADASGVPLQLAVLDIDHFKIFNDTWGHQTGDQVLRYVASVIGRVGAPPRFAARYGGEEFAMIFAGEDADCRWSGILHEICEEVASRRLKRRSTNEDLGAVTISAGFAERRPTEPPASLMDRADTALYESKRAGRNRVSKAEWKATAA